jgi:hypothetical protein
MKRCSCCRRGGQGIRNTYSALDDLIAVFEYPLINSRIQFQKKPAFILFTGYRTTPKELAQGFLFFVFFHARHTLCRTGIIRLLFPLGYIGTRGLLTARQAFPTDPLRTQGASLSRGLPATVACTSRDVF